MSPRTSAAAGWTILALMLCQFVPLNRFRSGTERAGAPEDEFSGVVQRRCGECHTLDTHWPRLAYVAPLSWYVVLEVRRARNAFDAGNPELASTKEKIRTMIASGRLSGHGTVPGFPKPFLSGPERQLLLDRTTGKDEEPRYPVNNSGATP
jgi:Haem-binding domain